ncbi:MULTISPECIES: tRNA guanosine(34) transglycosylase Tgt [unclassified Sphingobium]|uniref:tRNA guanosine(34) transglycosylase Tgt n=1 Tax=unclassified Sphingobium TaxID=2611147 RepID=UPI0022241AEA|nr:MULTISPECIES: tRNA guanosine(34) transglycosylase Tgt [unclassified Sphingobium]MCW2380791.1 queuine tRNA-ribosyltransferase [Sphingobium sp. B2D3B]MCW2399101.1 queuine tRNA-ribosyltransferase [Sphingobium sp. B2D3C]
MSDSAPHTPPPFRVPADPQSARFAFSIAATDGKARTGEIVMKRGVIRTPAFMPVGTAATVKAMRPAEVRAAGADIILGNTYHLMLRPGAERVAALGGLHALSGWERPILTDSGGYQVMSLSALTKVTEQGVAFASHIDGSRHMLSPERSMEIQRLLGSDIVMCFDELVPTTTSRDAQAQAMERSMRWAARSRAGFDAGGDHAARAALFGIQQGALDEELRKQSAQALVEIGFDGYAVGGLAVGEGQEAMFACLDHCVGHLPVEKPRYLMGVGKPDDIVGAVERGIDMFDCVLPTRSGRNGQAFTWAGPLNIRNARFAEDPTPLDARCTCPVCGSVSRAYLHHLVKAGEMLGAMLMTQHNLHFYQALMAGLRDAIAAGRLTEFASRFRADYASKAF